MYNVKHSRRPRNPQPRVYDYFDVVRVWLKERLNVFEPQRSPRGIVCTGFMRVVSGSLLGFADLHLFKCKQALLGCTVHQNLVSRWVHAPAKPLLGPVRQLICNRRGKLVYFPLLEWDDDDVRRAFSAAAVAAIALFDPTIFVAE